jgi:DNA polymerase III delta prime subunit
MNLDTALTVAQLISILIILPASGFRAWRKIDQRLTSQDMKLEKIHAQFHRNGGSSLRDQNDRMERDLARLTGRFDQHIEEGAK